MQLEQIRDYFQAAPAFNASIPFTKARTIMSVTLSGSTGNVILSPNTTGAITFAETRVIIIADGSHTVSVSGVNSTSDSGTFSSSAGTVNFFDFFFDGTTYYCRISQGGIMAGLDPILSISNLTRYYDAQKSSHTISTGNNITSIQDLSPLAVNATANLGNPQWNSSKGGIDFNTGTNFAINNLVPGSVFSMAFVMENNGLASSTLGIFLEGNTNYYVLSSSPSFVQNIDGPHAENMTITGGSLAGWTSGTKGVFIWTLDSSKNSVLYYNGTSIGTFGPSASNPISASANILHWGADNGTRLPNGTMYTMILANKTFSAGDISTITSTLKSRYSIV